MSRELNTLHSSDWYDNGVLSDKDFDQPDKTMKVFTLLPAIFDTFQDIF